VKADVGEQQDLADSKPGIVKDATLERIQNK
jgi:hypothetical protein